MKKKAAVVFVFLVALVAGLAPQTRAQVCGPDVDGRVAEVTYRESTILWDPVVEFDKVVLTIGGPCEDIVKVFGRGEPIFFDLREIERVGDGAYTWELRRVATVSSATKKALAEARKSGDDRIWWGLWQQGAIPQGPYVDSASFLVVNGVIVPPDQGEGKSKGPAIASPEAPAQFSHKVVLTNNNGVIRNSSCVGFDCPDSPTFGDTTILLMENNTRIKFDDTSVTAGFPNNDWEVQANSSASGGGNFFAVNDCANSSQGDCADDPLFKVEAGARANALYVESDGDIGAGTANPVLDLHLVNGDTPGIRLDQNGSGGFTAQVWDVAGNEANFFVRDVTGGSTLPFRIRPGAPSSSIDIASDGDVGIGTASPTNKLDIRCNSAGGTCAKISNASGTGFSGFEFTEEGGSTVANFAVDNSANITRLNSISSFPIGIFTESAERMRVTSTGSVGIGTTAPSSRLHVNGGDIRVSGGSFIDDGVTLIAPDYVFAPDYPLMPLAELAAFVAREQHLPNVPSAAEIKGSGLNLSQFQMRLLEKVEELTLYTLAQNEQITDLKEVNALLLERLKSLESRLAEPPPRN